MSSAAAAVERRDDDVTLVELAVQILNTADPFVKARLGESAAARWLSGEITRPYPADRIIAVPDHPARDNNVVKVVGPGEMPKLGKGGSLRSRQAMLHSLVHTESWAIDLSWDIIARFGPREEMPVDFFTDFAAVARDEARHFTLLEARLRQLDSFYGAFPAHDGLWDSAAQTSEQLHHRLAVEHCVHEARGLDVLPTTISRFRNGGDEGTAKHLEMVIYPEEITHCAAGVKWFKYVCLRNFEIPRSIQSPGAAAKDPSSKQQGQASDDKPVDSIEVASERTESTESCDEYRAVILAFHDTVRRYFRGPLKPPFNEQARRAAGFGPEWYEPVAVKEDRHVVGL